MSKLSKAECKAPGVRRLEERELMTGI